MKITKQGRFLPHPCPEKRQNVSGVQELDGEDLDFDSRQAYLKAQQKAALDDQIREKNMRKQMEDQEDYQYAAQTNQITRMRYVYNYSEFFSMQYSYLTYSYIIEECWMTILRQKNNIWKKLLKSIIRFR